MDRKRLTAFVCCMALSYPSWSLQAEEKIYRLVDKNGKVIFSDKPIDGLTVQAVKLKEPSVVKMVPSAPLPEAQPAAKAVHYSISVSTPEPDATIRNNQGRVEINAQVSPVVQGRYSLTFNQQILFSNNGSFVLTELPRGEHNYQISFINNKGKVLASSPNRRVFLHKASALIKPTSSKNN